MFFILKNQVEEVDLFEFGSLERKIGKITTTENQS